MPSFTFCPACDQAIKPDAPKRLLRLHGEVIEVHDEDGRDCVNRFCLMHPEKVTDLAGNKLVGVRRTRRHSEFKKPTAWPVKVIKDTTP